MEAPELREWMIAAVAARTGRPPGAISADEPFAALGVDSAQLMDLAGELQDRLGRPVAPSVAFEHPTIDALARELAGQAPAAAGPAEDGASHGTGQVPVAVVGLACRMPGAADARAFWQLLSEGRDAVGEVPADRWDDVPSGAVRHGGYLDDVAGFDARFFRLPAEEADRMDPQQRLLLEVCWEALEDAGELPARLRNSATGAFVGVSTNEYMQRQLVSPATMTQHTVTGCSPAVVAGRLAYLLDLRGPTLSVDTACSSSLVAVHLAVRAIRAGECAAAIAAGVNVMLEPELSAGLSRAGMLAPDGRCKTFSEHANGYVRGEGCGAVVLKPLPAALAAGDRVYAVIRGSAVTADGASNGLTAPNPSAQRAVLTAAYRDAGVEPTSVDYVECHGTGTVLGDQIEADALGAVVGHGRPAGSPALIGSVKTNIGHLEAAAGIAGLIKACLTLYHGVVPASLHAGPPSPHIAFAELGLDVVTRPRRLDRDATRPCRAGVSSFGFSGTNAHVVLENAPASPPPSAAWPAALPLSARTADGLDRLRRAVVQHLEREPESAGGVVYTASVRRTHHRPYRLAAVAAHPGELSARLSAAPTVTAVTPGQPRVLFAFSGQGTQWEGAGRELMDAEPLFASTIRRCDEAVADELGWSIESCLRGREADANTGTDLPETDLADTAVAQPVTVAVQIALARVLASYGVVPAAVVGHSVGEISAAVVAGLMDLEAGLRLAARRGQAMAGRDGDGSMLAVGLASDEAARYAGDGVSLAAVNAPRNCVLSGDPEVLEPLRLRLVEEGVFARRVRVKYAFHSARMIGAARRLADALGDLPTPAPGGGVPMYSTVSGHRVTATELDAGYWARGITQTVRFADAVTAASAEADGFEAVVELGGHPDLRAALRELAVDSGFAVLHTLERGQGDELRLLALLGRLYEVGASIRWERRHPDGGQVVALPPYPWARERHWIERPPGGRGPGDAGLLPGRPIELAGADSRVWETILAASAPASLGDHRVAGTVLMPAAGQAVLALRAAGQAGLADCTVSPFELHHPMPLDHGAVRVQTTLTPHDSGFSFAVHGRTAGASGWTRYATGGVTAASARPEPLDLDAAQLRCLETIPVAAFYRLLADQGLDYGPAFRILGDVWRCDGEAFGVIAAAPDAELADVTVLDAGVQLVAAAVGHLADGAGAGVMVPVRADALTAWAPLESAARAHVRLRTADDREIVADLTLTDGKDRPCVRLEGLLIRRSGPAGRQLAATRARVHRYQLAWLPRPVEDRGDQHGPWLILGQGNGVAERLGDLLVQAGVPVLRDPSSPEDREAALRLAPGPLPLAGVACLWPLDQPPEDGDLARLPAAVARLVHAVSFAAQGQVPRLLVATRGAQPVDGAVRDPAAAAVWGLMRCAPLENPVLKAGCVDLDPEGTVEDCAASLCAEMTATAALTGDTQVGYRRGERFVPRITAAGPPAGHEALHLERGGAYVITGGTGHLGRLAAGLLLERGAGTVALLSRSAGDANGQADALVPVAVDVSDRNALAAALQRVRALGRPIRGVLHAAGVLADGPLLQLSPAAIRAVLAGKAAGAAHLHELTQDDPLDWFVLYSSAASVLGSPGQANYAAANAYLDALAHHRRALGRPALAVNWGPWDKAGMAARSYYGVRTGRPQAAGDQRRLRTATSALDPADGLAQLERLMTEGQVQEVVLPFDLKHLVQFYPTSVGAAYFDEIVTDEIRILKAAVSSSSTRPELSEPYTAPRNEAERRIAAIWQQSLGIEPVGVHDSFFELGGDSVAGNRILVEINQTAGVTIDPEEAFQDFTVSHLAELAGAGGLDNKADDHG
jgi:acyl transferase domain-containing protein/acyl carrier protein